MNEWNADPSTGGAGACPICAKPASREHRPFCSKRCADVDLQRWLSGRYAIPVVEEENGSDDEPDGAPRGG
jgi:endogenous inhibitor of DNA gyrase (YacG/DUF329 family)